MKNIFVNLNRERGDITTFFFFFCKLDITTSMVNVFPFFWFRQHKEAVVVNPQKTQNKLYMPTSHPQTKNEKEILEQLDDHYNLY